MRFRATCRNTEKPAFDYFGSEGYRFKVLSDAPLRKLPKIQIVLHSSQRTLLSIPVCLVENCREGSVGTSSTSFL
jgi:hypothetical protein